MVSWPPKKSPAALCLNYHRNYDYLLNCWWCNFNGDFYRLLMIIYTSHLICVYAKCFASDWYFKRLPTSFNQRRTLRFRVRWLSWIFKWIFNENHFNNQIIIGVSLNVIECFNQKLGLCFRKLIGFYISLFVWTLSIISI